MGERLLDRAFNKALSQQRRADAKVEAERPLTDGERKVQEEEKVRQETAPMTGHDAIQRMLLAEKDKDYFRVLELPGPKVDALGRPAWDCLSTDISKAYRKLSSLVHPDKNPGSDARAAFEALNKAHRLLRDPSSREEILEKHLETAKRKQAAIESAATPDERVAMYAMKKTEAKVLQKQEHEKYKLEVLQQQQRIQERAKRKRELQERAKRRAAVEEEQESEEEATYTKKAKDSKDRRKGKPRIIF